jgi:hypothetical protein
MIEKIGFSQNIVQSGSLSKQTSAQDIQDKNVDVSVRVDNSSLVETAQQCPQTDPNIVEKARQLVLSGELENPENIRQAAENIIKYGI